MNRGHFKFSTALVKALASCFSVETYVKFDSPLTYVCGRRRNGIVYRYVLVLLWYIGFLANPIADWLSVYSRFESWFFSIGFDWKVDLSLYPMCHWDITIFWLDCQALADHATPKLQSRIINFHITIYLSIRRLFRSDLI